MPPDANANWISQALRNKIGLSGVKVIKETATIFYKRSILEVLPQVPSSSLPNLAADFAKSVAVFCTSLWFVKDHSVFPDIVT